MTPFPFLDWMRYASSRDRFPYPCSVRVKIQLEDSPTAATPATESPLFSRIARTPRAERPMDLTCVSANLMLFPLLVEMTSS